MGLQPIHLRNHIRRSVRVVTTQPIILLIPQEDGCFTILQLLIHITFGYIWCQEDRDRSLPHNGFKCDSEAVSQDWMSPTARYYIACIVLVLVLVLVLLFCCVLVLLFCCVLVLVW